MNKALAYILFFFLFKSNLSAQVKIDKLEDLWKIAIQNNPNQRVYALKREQLGYDYKTSENFYYPQASASFNGQDNLILPVTPVPGALAGQAGKTVYIPFGKHYTYNAGLTVTKDLFDWQTMLQSKIAKENIELNNNQQAAYTQTLKTQVGQYYFSALVAKASLMIAEKDLLISDSIYVAVKQKFDEGLTDASAVNQAEINKNAIQQNILQSNQLLNQAVANIKILAGMPAKTDIVFSEEAIDKEAEKVGNNLGDDKTLLPYKTSINISTLQQKEQKAALLPKITATGYFGFQEYRDRFEMSFAKNAWTDYQYIGLGLNWPLFTGFANSNKLKSSAVQKKIAEQDYEAAKEQSNTTDLLLIQNLTSYSELVLSSKSSFDLYGKNLELSRQKFKEGLISIDVYLKTFQDYLTAENVYLNNLSNLLSTKASIEARQ